MAFWNTWMGGAQDHSYSPPANFGSADCAQFGCAKVSWSSRLQSLGDRPQAWDHPWTCEIGPLQTASLWMVTQNRRWILGGSYIYGWPLRTSIPRLSRFTEDLQEKWWKKYNQIPRFSTTRYVAVNYSISWLFNGHWKRKQSYRMYGRDPGLECSRPSEPAPFHRATADGSQLLLNADPWEINLGHQGTDFQKLTGNQGFDGLTIKYCGDSCTFPLNQFSILGLEGLNVEKIAVQRELSLLPWKNNMFWSINLANGNPGVL